jgi:hypothetical protein
MARKAFTLKVTSLTGSITEFYVLTKSQVQEITATLSTTDTVKIQRLA